MRIFFTFLVSVLISDLSTGSELLDLYNSAIAKNGDLLSEVSQQAGLREYPSLYFAPAFLPSLSVVGNKGLSQEDTRVRGQAGNQRTRNNSSKASIFIDQAIPRAWASLKKQESIS